MQYIMCATPQWPCQRPVSRVGERESSNVLLLFFWYLLLCLCGSESLTGQFDQISPAVKGNASRHIMSLCTIGFLTLTFKAKKSKSENLGGFLQPFKSEVIFSLKKQDFYSLLKLK